VEHWNHVDQHVVAVSSINIFTNKRQQIRNQDAFLWISAKTYEPHLWIDCSWGHTR